MYVSNTNQMENQLCHISFLSFIASEVSIKKTPYPQLIEVTPMTVYFVSSHFLLISQVLFICQCQPSLPLADSLFKFFHCSLSLLLHLRITLYYSVFLSIYSPFRCSPPCGLPIFFIRNGKKGSITGGTKRKLLHFNGINIKCRTYLFPSVAIHSHRILCLPMWNIDVMKTG